MAGEVQGSEVGTADTEYRRAKTSVWWDTENCHVPKGCDAHAIAQNISSALVKLDYCGPVSISAYGDTNRIPLSVQHALSSTGVSLNHVPAGVKDATDKRILVDMLFWAVDNPAPANYLLISGDRDFANALHQLRMRRYNILLAQPSQASIALVAAAKSVWLWTSLVEGGPPRIANDLTPALNQPALRNGNGNGNGNNNGVNSNHNNHSIPEVPLPGNQVPQPSHTQMHFNNPPSMEPNQKFNSPDPKSKAKYPRKTPNQPSAHKGPLILPAGPPESKNIDYTTQSEHAGSKLIWKAPHEFFAADKHITFSGGSSSSGFPANISDPSGRDGGNYPGNQQTQYVHNTSTQPGLQKSSSVPSGFTESKTVDYSSQSVYDLARGSTKALDPYFGADKPSSSSAGWSTSNGFHGSCDVPGSIRGNFVGNQLTQYPYPPKPTTVPVHTNSALGNMYPPHMHNHTLHPTVPRSEAPSFSSTFTNANDMGNLSISERANFVQNSPNVQQAPRPEVKFSFRKHSSSASRNVSQKSPNMHMNHPYNFSTPNGRSSETGCNVSSLPAATNVLSGAGGQQGAVTIPPPSEYEQGLAGVILLALDNLKNEKIIPTEANIIDCIRFGDIKHQNTDARKALDCAVKQNMVMKQIVGQVQLYVTKNQLLWKCINPMGGNPNEYPKATWDRIKEFLISPNGRSAITASTCRYEAALILKNSCLYDFSLGQVLQLLNMLISVKRWVKHHPAGWKPVTVVMAEGDSETSNSAGPGI